jgi:hypothetical protein
LFQENLIVKWYYTHFSFEGGITWYPLPDKRKINAGKILVSMGIPATRINAQD